MRSSPNPAPSLQVVRAYCKSATLGLGSGSSNIACPHRGSRSCGAFALRLINQSGSNAASGFITSLGPAKLAELLVDPGESVGLASRALACLGCPSLST